MRVAIISSLIELKYGGPAAVVRMHAKAIRAVGQAEIFGVVDDTETLGVEESRLAPAKLYPRSLPARWYRGRGLASGLNEAAERFDVLHAHMLWDHSVYAAWRAGQRRRKPLVITPHGSLSQEWRSRGIVKRTYKAVLLDRILRDCSTMHVLNDSEADACRQYGITCPIEVIPNALPDLAFESTDSTSEALAAWPQLKGRRVALYLGRIWVEKGLEVLVDAWKVALANKDSDWCLVIAGPDYRGFAKQLAERIRTQGLEQKILLTGPVYGELKESLMALSELVVLLSFGEGFSMSILEAVAKRKPVLVSQQCHFQGLIDSGGGWESDPSVRAAASVLSETLQLSESELARVGVKAWSYARERYTMSILQRRLVDLYERIGR